MTELIVWQNTLTVEECAEKLKVAMEELKQNEKERMEGAKYSNRKEDYVIFSSSQNTIGKKPQLSLHFTPPYHNQVVI